MKMKSILLVVLALCLTVCMCACGGNENGDTTTTTNGGNAATTTTTTIAAPTTTTTVADGKVTYTVTVTDEAGTPVVGAIVQLCLMESVNGIPAGCHPFMSNAEGVATFRLPEAEWGVKVSNTPEGSGLAPFETYLYFEAGSTEMTVVLKAA